MRKAASISKVMRLGTLWSLALLGLGVAQYAGASCGRTPAAAPQPGRVQADGLVPVGFWQGGDDDDAAIVGLWKFRFVAGRDEIDAGYVTWHADGTELMNSGRAPMTGSFCMGVWRQIGRDTYKLNHFAMAWDDSGTNFVALVNIREEVKVDRTGKKYSGTFVQTIYSPDGSNVLQQIKGVVSATRVTPD